MNRKGISVFVVIAAIMMMVFSGAVVADAHISEDLIKWIKIDGEQFEDGEKLAIERGDDLTIKIKLVAEDDIEDIEIEAYISGYEYSDYNRISDTTSTFDLDANETIYKTLEITIPDPSPPLPKVTACPDCRLA